MGEDSVKRILKDVGLTEKETDLYIFLAKHGGLKGLEIAKQTRIDKAEIYRILKSLQVKGLLEATLETPTRFVTVPFDKVIDSFIKARRDEATLVEGKKKDLLRDWKRISRIGAEVATEKFLVIEGSHKIYPRIFQMIKEARSQLSCVATVTDLVRDVRSGFLDAASNVPSKSGVQLRFITELTEKNAKAMKDLLNEMSDVGLDFKGRSPDLGLQLSPRMVLKDNDEVVFFTTPKGEEFPDSNSDTGLWTNCRAIVQAFTRVFEDLWGNSTDVYRKLADIEAGGSGYQVYFTCSPEKVRAKYDAVLANAMEEISILTSSEGLIELYNNCEALREIVNKNVPARVMAPIVNENFEYCQKLSKFCDVRHVSEGNMTTIVVDGRHLFQFRSPKYPRSDPEMSPDLESSSYTDDFQHVEKARLVLNSIWNKGQILSNVKLESMSSQNHEVNPVPDVFRQRDRSKSLLRLEEYVGGGLTEKDVISKIINAKRVVAKNPLTHMNIQYGSMAEGVIHPPAYFNLPDMRIHVCHWNKQSSWGAEDWLEIYLWLETPNGYRFVPVAHITDNAKAVEFRKGVWAGTPAAQNVIRAKKEKLQVRVQGNTLFAGWTMPIPLYPPSHVLPPCCILFEGHGPLKTGRVKTSIPSGKTQVHEYNGFEAFVTFFHPASKYSGPGTDGIFNREHIMTAYPPISKMKK